MESHLAKSFHIRITESEKLRNKYPERYPIVIGRGENCRLNDTSKFKFIVPGELSVGQFVYVLRKHIELTPEQAIFLMFNNCLTPTSSLISDIYEEHRSTDGFLYAIYTGENVFG